MQVPFVPTESRWAPTGVAVEKLTSQKSAEIRSREEALQTICRGRQTFSVFKFALVFRDFEFFNIHRQTHSLRCGA
jgi:hypothetical protein